MPAPFASSGGLPCTTDFVSFHVQSRDVSHNALALARFGPAVFRAQPETMIRDCSGETARTARARRRSSPLRTTGVRRARGTDPGGRRRGRGRRRGTRGIRSLRARLRAHSHRVAGMEHVPLAGHTGVTRDGKGDVVFVACSVADASALLSMPDVAWYVRDALPNVAATWRLRFTEMAERARGVLATDQVRDDESQDVLATKLRVALRRKWRTSTALRTVLTRAREDVDDDDDDDVVGDLDEQVLSVNQGAVRADECIPHCKTLTFS